MRKKPDQTIQKSKRRGSKKDQKISSRGVSKRKAKKKSAFFLSPHIYTLTNAQKQKRVYSLSFTVLLLYIS